MTRLICPGCYEEITDMVGTTSTVTEEEHAIYHTKCDPIQIITSQEGSDED